MKKILCFGDSNTFGFKSDDFRRYSASARWSGIIKEKLKGEFLVDEHGLNNRTCFNSCGEYNSLVALPKRLNTFWDCIILQIGINDLQFQYNTDLAGFERAFEKLFSYIDKNTKVILLCPNVIDECILKSSFKTLFNETSIEKSKHLSKIYDKISKKFQASLIDLNKVARVSPHDGLHYDSDNHKLVADTVLEKLKEIFF